MAQEEPTSPHLYVEQNQENMAQEEPTSPRLSVDDFYFSALIDQLQNNAQEFEVSDAKYAEELQFQEALMASVQSVSAATNYGSTPPSTTEIGSTSASSIAAEAGLVLGHGVELNRPCAEDTAIEEEEMPDNFCQICAEKREVEEMFSGVGKCSHTFCSYCISKHVAVKIQEKARVVTCPAVSCGRVLGVEECRGVVAREVMERWDEVASESLIPAAQKFYCPFLDCSALMVDDNEGEAIIRESECPACRRLFCAACYVPWHSGVECEEYQRMNEDERGKEDLMLRELAQEKKWRRCPHCKFYVEKTEGCLHITCRCMYEFCYGCGAQWNQNHGGCQTQ